MRKWVILGVFALMPFVFVTPAMAMTIYVDARNNSGIEDGSIANPYNTIQEAILAAPLSYSWSASGWPNEVSVAPGTYYGSLEMKQGVRLISQQGPENTIIDAAGANIAIWPPFGHMPWIQMNGFTVRNAARMLIYSVRRAVWANDTANYCVIDHCILEDSGEDAIYANDKSILRISNTLVRNVRNGVRAYGSWLPEFQNLTIDNAETAFFMVTTNGAVTLNNTTISNVAVPFYIHVPYLKNFYPTRLVGSNNNFYNVAEPYLHWHTTSQLPSDELVASTALDPLFVDLLKQDYRLQPGSPLVDAGIDLGGPYYGNAPDVGAFEYDSRTIDERLADLTESFQEVPVEEFKEIGERRRDAFHQKLGVIHKKLAEISAGLPAQETAAIYAECLDKLSNDILPKVDGFFGGNPNNDWIVSFEEQNLLYPQITALIAAIGDLAGPRIQ